MLGLILWEKENTMKYWMIALVALLLGSGPLVAEDAFQIRVGRPGARDLTDRVRELERTVTQMERRIFDLERLDRPREEGSRWITCYLKTPFDGIFLATERTEIAARAQALQRCAGKANQVFCKERELLCGR